jgi:predicted permease
LVSDLRRHRIVNSGDRDAARTALPSGDVSLDNPPGTGGESVRDVIQDLRYALRGLARSPGFAILAVLTLALGIGANAAIFSVINSVMLRPLEYPQPDRLLMITSQFPGLGFDRFWVSPPEYFELRERAKSFSEVGAYTTTAVNLSEGDAPERVNAVGATSTLFDALGVTPRLGRTFTEAETLPNADPVVVLSSELWERKFAADPTIIGRAIEVDGARRTVVGVMPPGFDVHDSRAELWAPLPLDPANRQNRGSHYLYLVGRLAPDVTLAQARAELENLLIRWRELNPDTHVPSTDNHRLQYASLQDDVIGNVRTALWVLQGAVAFVLLIACANLANLLLARAESRHREFAIRTALGAGRLRLLRQFVTEGVALAVIGGAIGVALAWFALRALIAASPEGLPRAVEIGIDPLVLTFTLGIAVLSGVVFGLAPLLHIRQQAVSVALKDSGTRTTSSMARNRVRHGLVVAEVALAVVLVVGSGLMLRSFWNLMNVDSGFDRSQLVTFGVSLPAQSYTDAPRRVAFYNDLTSRLTEVPGIQGATITSGLPPLREVNANDTEFEGLDLVPGQGPPANVDYYTTVSDDFFQTMGIPIVDGRAFTPSDDAEAPPVLVINETTAKRYYPGRSAVGQRIRPGYGDDTPWLTVVGVAKDVKQGGLDQETGTELYFLHAQQAPVFGGASRNMNVVMRTTLPLASLAPTARSVLAGLDRTLPMVDLQTMDDAFVDSVGRQRFLAQLLATFAGLALLLAAIGTYGILAFMVSERQREIGIRMALGADRGTVMGMVLRQGMTVCAVGLVAGVVGSLILNRLATSLLFGVSPADPGTIVAVIAVIVTVALAACVVPARRATRIDPMVALREE